LDHPEYRVVRFIFDRTAGWGKEWEAIPMRHFLAGVVGENGVTYAPPLNLSQRTVERALARLREVGALLARERSGAPTSYSLNYEWNPMRIPKRLREAQIRCASEHDTPVTGDAPTPVTHDAPPPSLVTPHKRGKEKSPLGKENMRESCGLGACDGVRIETKQEIEEALANAASRSRKQREAKKADGYYSRGPLSGLVPSAGAMRRIWTDCHVANLPDLPVAPLPDKSVHMLRSYAKEFNARNPKEEWVDFLAWLFKNWTAITRTTLAWMTNTSKDAPHPAGVASAKLRPFFERAWAERKLLDAIFALPPREREIRYTMLNRGVSREVAEKMAKTQKESEGAMDAVKAERENLEIAKKRFEVEQQADARQRRNRAKPASPLVITDGDDDTAFEDALSRSRAKRWGVDAGNPAAGAPARRGTAKNDDSRNFMIPETFPAWEDEDSTTP
jgi:hypothetical protein